MFTLRVLRKLYSKVFKKENNFPKCIEDAQIAYDMIYDRLNSNEPLMIARFGSTELINIVNYLGVTNKKYKNYIGFIKSETPAWWWQKNIMNQLQNWSGFFPPTEEKITQFSQMMIEDSKEVDILGSWLENEHYMKDYMHDEKIHLRFLEPFWSNNPWTRVLKDKRVLVVHPFKNTIESQYQKRELLFENKEILPKFKSLTVIRAVQSIGGNSEFKDWFEALEYMKDEIDKVDYDICLIGAGAYGFPLAAHVKRQGKQGLHIGGALQLFFGIKGTRWEIPDLQVKGWGIEPGFYLKLMNEYWVRPDETERPKDSEKVEGNSYW